MLEHSRQTKATRRKGEIHLSKDFSVGRGRQGEKLGICVDSVNLLLSVLSSLSSQPHRRQRDTGLCGWVGGAPLLTCGHSMQRGGVGCSRCCPRSSRSALSTCCQEEDGHFKGTAQTEAANGKADHQTGSFHRLLVQTAGTQHVEWSTEHGA